MLANNKKKRKKKFKIAFETYTKSLVAIIIFVCLIDLQLTYVLAFVGKEQIAETLSVQICITILGVALVYMIRAFLDTYSEKKNGDNTKDKSAIENIIDGIDDIIDSKKQ